MTQIQTQANHGYTMVTDLLLVCAAFGSNLNIALKIQCLAQTWHKVIMSLYQVQVKCRNHTKQGVFDTDLAQR